MWKPTGDTKAKPDFLLLESIGAEADLLLCPALKRTHIATVEKRAVMVFLFQRATIRLAAEQLITDDRLIALARDFYDFPQGLLAVPVCVASFYAIRFHGVFLDQLSAATSWEVALGRPG